MKKRAVIFDMDGVIVDSNPFHKQAWYNFLKRHGVHVNEDIFLNTISGTTGDQALRILLGVDFSESQIAQFVKDIDAEYRELISASVTLVPMNGITGLLKPLRHAEVGIALATSAPDENIDLILNKLALREYFDVIVGKAQVIHGKPHPEVFLTTMTRISMTSEQCLVFEDSLSGVRAARNAGIRVIGVTSSHTHSELISAGAQSTIHDFTEITLDDIVQIIHYT